MRVVRVLLLCLMACLAAGSAWAIELAGSVIRLQGSALATGGTGFSRPLQEGSTLLVGDRVSTGPGSRLALRMTDGGQLTLGSASSITIDTWDASPTEGRATLGLVEGVVLATSGAIARLGPDRMVINTPVAVLGVRGTEVWVQSLEARLAVAMFSGTGVSVTTGDRTVELTQPDSGVDVVAGEPLPDPKPWGAPRLEQARQDVAFTE